MKAAIPHKLLSFCSPKLNFTMNENPKSKDFFSKFVNWFNALGNELPTTNREGGSQDFFSKLMNRISE